MDSHNRTIPHQPPEQRQEEEGGAGSSLAFPPPLSVTALQDALSMLFRSNFDADSKPCVLTLLKVVDNILQQPQEPKVRTLKVQNPALQTKIFSRPGGLQFLLACGFTADPPPPPSFGSSLSNNAATLLLTPDRENVGHLLAARRLLATAAVQDLGLAPDDLPTFRPPPPRTSTHAASSSFDPYRVHRYDAQSAAVGTNLRPEANYVSSTEQELQRLLRQQVALEAQLHPPTATTATLSASTTPGQGPAEDRGWRAHRPHDVINNNNNNTAQEETTVRDTPAPGDAALLAAAATQQAQQRRQREQGGLTTQAMRDLERLKKQKVYSHVAVTVQFPDGIKLTGGRFYPSETVGHIKNSILHSCLLLPSLSSDTTTVDFDLYMTPPRRLLTLNRTLAEEGLVPAAKIYVSWKGLAPATLQAWTSSSSPGSSYLQPHLFDGAASSSPASSSTTTAEVAYPSARPVVAGPLNPPAASSSATEDQKLSSNNNSRASDREEAMLRRMLGGTTNSSTLPPPAVVATAAAALRPDPEDAPSSSKPKKDGRPKWFKG